MLTETHNKLDAMVMTHKNENYKIIYMYAHICMSTSDSDNVKTTTNKNNSK
jgi:hypothetical protein